MDGGGDVSQLGSGLGLRRLLISVVVLGGMVVLNVCMYV